MWWCCQGVVLILIWRLVPVPPITNGWYWHSLQGGQAQTLYISTSVRREDRGQSSSQGLADTEIQNSVGNCSACTLSCSPSTTDKDTLVLVPRLYNNPLPVECAPPPTHHHRSQLISTCDFKDITVARWLSFCGYMRLSGL